MLLFFVQIIFAYIKKHSTQISFRCVVIPKCHCFYPHEPLPDGLPNTGPFEKVTLLPPEIPLEDSRKKKEGRKKEMRSPNPTTSSPRLLIIIHKNGKGGKKGRAAAANVA